MVNIDEIKGFGIAPSLNESDEFMFIFNNNNINSDINIKVLYGLMCDEISSKFCLYNKTRKEIVLIIDFIIFGQSQFIPKENQEEYIKILILYVEEEYRKKGIARYYLNELIKLARKNNINKFKLYPNPDDEIFEHKKNSLSKKELEDYYIRVFNENGFKYKKEYYEDDLNPSYCFYI